MKHSPFGSRTARAVVLFACCLTTTAIAQTNPRIRDHRDPRGDKEPAPKVRPVEGPIVQWRLVSDQVVSDQILAVDSSRPATRYRLMTGDLQLTSDPQVADRPFLRRFSDPGMKANFVYHRSRTDAGIPLNEPFALYLPGQRAYMVQRRERPSEGSNPIIVKPLPPGLIGAPVGIGFAEWDPARPESRVRPDDIYQWVLRIPRDHRTRTIKTERQPIGNQPFIVSEELALFNTTRDAYLVYGAQERRLDWRER